MTVRNLIDVLSKYPPTMWVDCNDAHGTYSDIEELIPQSWTDRDGNEHEVITIMHKGYDPKNSIV